jgi:very-short-patch-repair endonuclease
MGSFVVDFFCPEARLVIEVDGGQHNESASDERRTAWLEAQGYRVVRFWNNEVLRNTDGVLETLLGVLRTPSPPTYTSDLTFPLKGGRNSFVPSW